MPDLPKPAPSRGDDWIDIGAMAQRCGVAASALRYYEAQGLLQGGRSTGGRRRYPRSAARRVAFIRIAQSIGLSLAQIHAALATLPAQRTPTQADWARLSRAWQPLLQARIDALVRLRDQLGNCIGCGCLSLRRCALFNPGDVAGARGAGPRYLLGDSPPVGAGAGAGAPAEVQPGEDPAAGRQSTRRRNTRRSGSDAPTSKA